MAISARCRSMASPAPCWRKSMRSCAATFPTILCEHPLLRWWGFKYDGKLKGTNVHADFAAININFWIAPDDANLDPESGGLVVWDKAAPRIGALRNTTVRARRCANYLDAGRRQSDHHSASDQPRGGVQLRSVSRNRQDRFQGRLSQPAHQHHDALWPAQESLKRPLGTARQGLGTRSRDLFRTQRTGADFARSLPAEQDWPTDLIARLTPVAARLADWRTRGIRT